ncbi:MAG: ISLre2 family transposase [Candidatus Omnitrophota bacterium]
MDTISIAFPVVKINLPVEGLTFSTLEQSVFDITQALGRKVLEKALIDVDERLKTTRSKGVLMNTGKRAKYFMTRLGDIRYKRTRYIDTATGKSRYLLEEHLGLRKNQRVSLIRSKIEMFIASITTYRDTEENVELLTGYRRSHESIRQSVIKEAEGILAHQDAAIDKIIRLEDNEVVSDPPEIAYLEADSAFIRRQSSRKRKRKNGFHRQKRRSIEVKLAIGYTDKVKRSEAGRGKGLKLKNKFTYTSIESGRIFMEKLSLIAEKKLSLSKVKALIFGGDGGAYISAGIRDYFVNVIYILCKFHLKRNVKRSLPSMPNTQGKINGLLGRDEIDKALSLITKFAVRAKDRKEKDRLKELHTYIDQNRDGINPINRIKDKALRKKIKGAGAMESNVDKFIAHRFKKRGMSWSEKGALSLLKVRETISNGEWDSWWLEGRDEKIEIRPEPLKQLTAKNFWKAQKNAMPFIEATIPALQGPDRNEPWAKVLREIQDIDYYKRS